MEQPIRLSDIFDDSNLIPTDLICPLTQKMFKEPVKASDHITYEYQVIVKWLSSEDTSPVSGCIMENDILETNTDVLNSVNEYLLKNPEAIINQFVPSNKHCDNIKRINEIIRSKNYKMLLDYVDFDIEKLFNEITDFKSFMENELLVIIHIINNAQNLEATIINGWQLIHVICLYSTRMLQFIIKKGVNLNILEDNGMAPLHIVTKQDNLEAIKLLIAYGANPLITSPNGWNIIHYACKCGSLETVTYLVELFKSNEEYNKYLELPTLDGWRPIHFACHHGSAQVIYYLVKIGMNLQVVTEDNWTPLHIVCLLSNKEMIKHILDQNVDTSIKIKQLYDKPVKCSYRDLINMNSNLTKADKKELELYKRISFKQRKIKSQTTSVSTIPSSKPLVLNT